jgi:hypothetical protein
MGQALKRVLGSILILFSLPAHGEERLAVFEFFVRGSGEYCINAAPSVIALQDEMQGRAVMLEYPYDSFRSGRVDRFWAAYSGPSPSLPLTMVGSGLAVAQGPVDYARRYREMLDLELARPPKAVIRAWSRRSGNGLQVFASAWNQAGWTIGPASRATLWLIVWEEGRIGLTKTFVRATASKELTSQVHPGGSKSVTFDIPTLSPTNWQNVRALVLLDELPPCNCSPIYDMLQAAVAQPPSVIAIPSAVVISPAAPEAELSLDGPQVLDFSATPDVAWLSVTPPSGTLPARVTVRLSGSPPPGATGTLTFAASGAGMDLSTTAVVTAQGTVESWSAVVPAVAHAPGAFGSLWRTDLAAVNSDSSVATVKLTFIPVNGDGVVRTDTLLPGGTCEWGDVLASLFGVGLEASASGVVRIASDRTLAVSSSTYNQADDATFGGYLPAVTAAEALAPGKIGILPQLTRNERFRTNVGLTNLGDSNASVTVRMFGESAEALGVPVVVSVPAGGLVQIVDVFGASGAGDRDLAYASVEVSTPGAFVWAYASVVDNRTSDPTNIPLEIFDAGSLSSGTTTTFARTVPSVGHAPGAYGSLWRTDVALVNASTSAANATFRYVPAGGGDSITKTASLPLGTSRFDDILVSLFDLDMEASASGALHIASDAPLVVSSRTYNTTEQGTYGAHLAGIGSARAVTHDRHGVIPQLKRGPITRTNVALTNLGSQAATVGIRLHATDGGILGTERLVTIPPGGLVQENDIFAACGTGDAPIAWARIEVKSEGGEVFAFASVVDNRTGDPTFVPVILAPR